MLFPISLKDDLVVDALALLLVVAVVVVVVVVISLMQTVTMIDHWSAM